MAKPYLYERQSEYWTSRQIEEFFLDAGFELIALPILQYHEKEIPADFIFFHKKRSKLFAFQYKALYSNDRDFWPIDEAQHHALSDYPWIYYCLSELRSARDARSALHLARIVPPNFEYKPKVYTVGQGKLEWYSRWGAFFQGLEQCRNGILITAPDQLKEVLKPRNQPIGKWRLSELAVDAFLADFETRHAVHFSSFLRDVEQ